PPRPRARPGAARADASIRGSRARVGGGAAPECPRVPGRLHPERILPRRRGGGRLPVAIPDSADGPGNGRGEATRLLRERAAPKRRPLRSRGQAEILKERPSRPKLAKSRESR